MQNCKNFDGGFMKSFEAPRVIQELIRDSRAVMNGVCGVWVGDTWWVSLNILQSNPINDSV